MFTSALFDFMLMSSLGPIVESSTNMGFGCYSYNYFNLLEHLEKAGLNIWNNTWCALLGFYSHIIKNVTLSQPDDQLSNL
jgi:hypothetical protein